MASLDCNHTLTGGGDYGRLGYSPGNICDNFYTPEFVQDGGYNRGGGEDFFEIKVLDEAFKNGVKVLNRIGRWFSSEGVDGLSYAMSEEVLDPRSLFFRRPGFTLCAHHCVVDCCSAKIARDQFLSNFFALASSTLFL